MDVSASFAPVDVAGQQGAWYAGAAAAAAAAPPLFSPPPPSISPRLPQASPLLSPPPPPAPTTGNEGEGSPPQAHAHLEADEGFLSDDDSAYGSSVASSSLSLASSITHYKYENGRRYHAYREGEYILPNDEEEQARLDLQHHIYRLGIGGALYTAPIDQAGYRLQAALDIGTGTGIWAIEFADAHPGTTVLGTDLSPIQPGLVPPNVKFYVDDLEESWSFPEVALGFDYIHWRSLNGSTGDWPRLYRQAWQHLRPGAWLEVQEYDAWVYSDEDAALTRAPCTREWCATLDRVSTQFGKVLNVGRLQRRWMLEAGFVDVVERVVKVPVGPWARARELKELGRYERCHMNESVEAHSMALYTRVLGYTAEQAAASFAKVRAELNDRSLRLYTVYRFLHGRRPEK